MTAPTWCMGNSERTKDVTRQKDSENGGKYGFVGFSRCEVLLVMNKARRIKVFVVGQVISGN